MLTPSTIGLISTILGADTDLYALRRSHPDTSPEHALISLVVTAARRLSYIEENLCRRLAPAAGVLDRVRANLAAGAACNASGELLNTGVDIDTLAARHADAHEWLIETLHAYHVATTRQ
jgi:hypothetical protein